MRRGRSWLAAAGLGLLGLPALAQAPAGWALKITPQYVVVSGLWLEAERALAAHPSQSLTAGLQLYAGPTGQPDVAFDPAAQPSRTGLVRGVGVQAQHRLYLAGAGQGLAGPTGLYLGYGPSVQFFHLSAARTMWHEETTPTGLPYLVYGNVRHHENVLRYGGAVQVGYQWAPVGRLLLDVYAGLGLRESHAWAELGASEYRSGPSDYAHRGFYVPAGFKLGLALR